MNPFQFLDFIKSKNLFDIPDELLFSKTDLDSGKYSWQTGNLENPDSSNHLDLDDGAKLPGKELQELGRLRTEKTTMDATVKAAIEVGKFLQTKISEDKKIVKKEIQDIVHNFDKSIPVTRTDFIWRSIDEQLKKGSGRPPNAKS